MAGAARLELPPEHSHVPHGGFFLLYFAIGDVYFAMAASVTELCPFGGLLNVSPALIRNPAWFYWILLMRQRKAPDLKVISFMMSSFLELRSSCCCITALSLMNILGEGVIFKSRKKKNVTLLAGSLATNFI